MTRRHFAVALAVLLAAEQATAFVRTRDRGSGKELFWAIPVVPWYVNPTWQSTSPTCQGPGDPTFANVKASFDAWEQSCADLQLLHAGTLDEIRTGLGGTSENLVVFRHGWCSQTVPAADPCLTDPAVPCSGKYNCFDDEACQPGNPNQACDDWKIVALTSVLYEPDTGRILDADIELNGWDGVNSGGALPAGTPPHGWYFTCGEQTTQCQNYGQGACRYMDLRNTLTHEVGHFIGLAHAPDQNVTMNATTSPGEDTKRSLSDDDVAGVCAIYPGSDGDGGCGCGSGGAPGTLALVVAGLALRRRKVS